jgi:UDP-glucose 4-epimerase
MILITGGMGFIGLHTARRFVEVGEDVVIGYHRSQRAPSFLKDAWEKHVFAEPLDVTDMSDWLAIGRRYPMTGIVHMAVPGVGANAVALSKEFKTDTHGLLHALEMAQQWQVQRLSLASSQAVYRGVTAGPFREDMPLPVDSRSGTEVYKKVWENVGQYVAAGWGLDVIAIRIAGIYGPLFYHPAPFMAMSMVRATCTAAAQSGVQPNYGNIPGGIPYAEMGADLCYVQDCARGMQLLQHAPKDTLKHTVYNLGSGRETTQAEVAAVVQQAVPQAQTPLQAGQPPNQKPHPYMDITRVQQDVGYQPEWPLDRAIPDYIAWLRHHPE